MTAVAACLAGAVLLVLLADTGRRQPASPATASDTPASGVGETLRADHRAADPTGESGERVPVFAPGPPQVMSPGYELKDVRDLVLPGRDQTPVVTAELLIANLKDVTGRSHWEGPMGGRIDAADAGYLLVRADDKMQRMIDEVLVDIRRFWE